MMIRLRIIITIIVLIGCVKTSMGQEEIFQRGFELGIGGRALGMGGAFIGISDDYSASFWNPAGLTQIRRIEGYGGLLHQQRQNVAAFDDNFTAFSSNINFRDDLSSTKINSAGLAYPIPTYQGSLVFSVGFNRIHPNDSNFGFSGFNSSPRDLSQQTWSIVEEGSLNNWVFAGALEVSENTSVGLSLNFWTGNNDSRFSFTDIDVNENDVIKEIIDVDTTFTLIDFQEIRRVNTVESTYSGFNLKLGFLTRLTPFLRLGGTISTPIFISGTDKFRDDEVEFDNSGDETGQLPNTGEIDFKLRSPFSVAGGGAINIGSLLLGGSLEWTDWSQTRYLTDPPFSLGIPGFDDERSLANDSLRTAYRSVVRVRLGAEYTIPDIDLQIRGGYVYDPEIIKDLPSETDREFFTSGIGFFLNKKTRLDLTYIRGEWTQFSRISDFTDIPPVPDVSEFTADDYTFSEKIAINKVLATLAFRF